MNCVRITESGAGLQILNGIECLQDLHPDTYQPIDFLIQVSCRRTHSYSSISSVRSSLSSHAPPKIHHSFRKYFLSLPQVYDIDDSNKVGRSLVSMRYPPKTLSTSESATTTTAPTDCPVCPSTSTVSATSCPSPPPCATTTTTAMTTTATTTSQGRESPIDCPTTLIFSYSQTVTCLRRRNSVSLIWTT